MKEHGYPKKPKVHAQYVDNKLVLTTNSRDVASLPQTFCDGVNVTDTPREYHCQAWVRNK